MKGWFEKLAREEPALNREPAPGIRIHVDYSKLEESNKTFSGANNFESEKNFGSKKVLGLKEFKVRKILGPKIIRV